ncbi:Predicted dithiol-disulfide isomerase, DsbA family [Catalinimonas alkaloidigena]|uniref:Predicted dithiol-disulfide isomerase, DsbA family n=1 Tax=Catalinimonas alkaloidigena TaxID=1075417 RepID=A0A1G8XMN2_9BACT|nr:DsbA family oxidoreductase [Catalinimonas alkaloidigena]SDJ91717.1 Predicted dithiol-disulfide isomerase, DsbA family [Catalinimonas alkaloidigena]
MEVEIWSDVMCPFCYIGKRKFEAALAQFPHAEKVEVTWKSFQLNPDMPTDPGKNIHQYLAEVKGWSLEQAREMNDRVTDMARQVGLTYHFDRAVVANSFDAHRLLQLAKRHGLGDALEERLFRAYFTEGKNTADPTTLLELGQEIGLDADEIRTMLAGDQYADAVERDIYESRQIGVRGVPFFVFDRKYAVSGAQESAWFLQVLEKSFAEWQDALPQVTLDNPDGDSCTVDGDCG